MLFKDLAWAFDAANRTADQRLQLKGRRAGEYVKKMVHLYPGVWSGFGEIHFKKQEFSEELAGRPTEPYGPSIDAIFDVIGEMRAFAVVHCDEDTPHNPGLLRDPSAHAIFNSKLPAPQYLEAFNAFLKSTRTCR